VSINAKIREFVAQNSEKIVLVDLEKDFNFMTMSAQERKDLWDDHLHFSPKGYDKLAELIFTAMETGGVLKEIRAAFVDNKK
jgi:lysophospholipase L1-like esterase